MKRFQRLAWFSVAALACNVGLWTSVVGCSGDDNQTDAGDAALDNTQPDVNKPDVNPGDSGDGGVVTDGDAGFDASAILNFRQAYAAGLCKAIGKYCYGSQLDSGVPDAGETTCEQFVMNLGGGLENAVGDLVNANAVNSGHIHVNATPAASCLAGLGTMTVPTIPGSEYATLAQNCLGALSGDIAVGQPCDRTVECNNGFCKPSDAGAKCAALGAANSPCGSGQGSGNDECMYRGWLGSTQLRCDLSSVDGGPTSNVCTPKFANNSSCVFEWECQSNTCDDNYTCNTSGTAWTLVYAGVCPYYFGQDSGLN